jgi:hypothetical protein
MARRADFAGWPVRSWREPINWRRLFFFTSANLGITLLLYYALGQDLQKLIEAFDWLWNHTVPNPWPMA